MTDLFYEQSFGNDIDSKFARNRIKKTQAIIAGIVRRNKIKTCLDIGSGTGYMSGLVKQLDSNIACTGIDISAKAIALARQKYPEVNFVQEDIAAWSKSKAKFDLILSLENIEHIYNLDEYLASIDSLLKPGGVLIVSTPNLNSWLNRLLVLFGRIPYFQEYFFNDTVPVFSVGKKDFPSRQSIPSGHIRIMNYQVLKFIAKKFDWKIEGRYGAGLYAHKVVLGSIDKLFSYLPSFASCIVFVYKKK